MGKLSKQMESRRFKPVFLPLVCAISAVLNMPANAEDGIEVLEVTGHHLNNSAALGSVDQLLQQQGVDFSAAGGMSNLPVLNGMMGDRIKVLVDGADITASCANQMNPPLSYVSASQVQTFEVVAGISPVSVAGDNIAGVISVNEIAPLYLQGSELGWHSGYASSQYKSNNKAKSLGLGARFASDSLSIDYQGAYEDAQSYQDGRGDIVLDTLYRAQNHSLTIAMRDDKQQLAIKLTHQSIPFQGFANQYMDMTDNKSYGLTSIYQRQFESGDLQAQLNWHGVKHEMGFFTPEKTGMMPMNTDADDYSYRLKWRFNDVSGYQLTLGHEFFEYRLDDWWPALENSMMMGPNDYVNINDGSRQRLALFAEITEDLGQDWWLSAGVRFERVRTNTGQVQAYFDDSAGMMNMSSSMNMGADMSMGSGMDMSMRNTSNFLAAEQFNALDRARSDSLYDLTLLMRRQLSPTQLIEFGLARKNRAPNLYERYSWGVSTMATTMIGWFGDGNGYIGNPDLNPETAHTFSATFSQNEQDKTWQFSANIWYTSVKDYIDAQVIDSFNRATTAAGKRNILQFTNLDATLYGVKLSTKVQLSDSDNWGLWYLDANLSSTKGERDDSDENLYQIMPLQTDLRLTQQFGNWQNSAQWLWVGRKSQVDSRRLENMTDSYHLLNLQSQLTLQELTLSFAITNVFDRLYEQPLGGVSIAEYKADSSMGFSQLLGAGRSVNIGVSYAF